MKKLNCYIASLFLAVASQSFAAAPENTPAQVPTGIAIGAGLNVEVNFPNMNNAQGCSFSGAFVVDQSLDAETKKAILSVLLTAKASNQRVRVGLSGCTDRPKINYAFFEATWVGGF